MRYPLISFFIAFLPFWVQSQALDKKLDSLKGLLNQEMPAWDEAETYRKIMWHIFQTEEVSYKNFPDRLDSVYQCCLKGKTDSPQHEQLIHAEIVFFTGAALLLKEPDSAQVYIEKAIPLFGAIGDSANMANSYLLLTSVAVEIGDSLLFAKYYINANALVSYLTDPDMLALFHNNIGIGCYDFGRYADAASHYFISLELVDKYRTPVLLQYPPDTYHNIAGVYRRLDDYENSLFYAQKALESAVACNRDPTDHYSMLGWIYTENGRHQLGLEAFQCVNDQQDNILRVAEKFYGQANCYRNLGDVATALPLARKAVELLPISVNVPNGAAAMEELAACEFASGLTDLALKHALLAYEAFSGAANNRGKSNSAALLTEIYTRNGDYKKALMYSEIRYTHQRQIERQQSSRQLAFGEFTRDNAAQTARREAEVVAQLNRQRYIRYALFAGLGILAMLAFLLYNRYRYKQRTTDQLEIKNQEIEAARKRAEASEAFKSRFLANMSHEIRTPLHGISGFTELLLDTSLNEKQHRWLTSIQYSTDRLSDVVNDILDISKLEAGEVKLRQIPFSPSRLVADVQDGLRMKAEKNGTQLIVHIADDVPKALLGDPTRLYQILMNLAGNAVKFTENGSVTLSVKNTLEASHPLTSHAPLTILRSHDLTFPTPPTFLALSEVEESRSHDLTLLRSCALTFCVTDTGIGISPEKLSAIFESFQQASDDTTARFGGTGLGLTIARELVRLYGSDIHVESEPGKGSSFSFTVTLPETDPASLVNEHQINNALHFKQSLRILLADDNALNREIAVEAIKRHFENAVVTEAVNGREVIEQAQQNDFDVVLMDMQMPEMNGAEATIYIRNHLADHKRQIPIIALTASATPEEIENAIQAGMNRHLGKPFKSRELAQAIAVTLGLTSTPLTIGEAATKTITEVTLPEQQLFDLSFLFEFAEGDTTQMLHFIQKFMDNCPKEMASIDHALEEGNMEGLYLAAHSFRPQLEFVGMKGAASLLLEIERGARGGMSISQVVLRFEEVKTIMNRIPEAKEWFSESATQ